MANDKQKMPGVLTVHQRKELYLMGAQDADLRSWLESEYDFDEMKILAESLRDAKSIASQGDADRQAKAIEHSKYPEMRDTSKLVSVFHPNNAKNATLPKCEMYWNGQPVLGDVDTDEEVALLNQIVPGVYRCTKADGSIVKVTVEGQFNERAQVTRLTFAFPCSGLNKHNLKSRSDMLREMITQQPAPAPDKPVQLVTA